MILRWIRLSRKRKKLFELAKRISSMGIAFCLLATLLLAASPALAADVAPPSGEYVSDYANILSESVERDINAASKALEQQGNGAQIMVLTVEDMGGMDVDRYALQVLRGWGIGSAEHNNGVLIIVSMKSRDVKIEVGTGLEGRLNDSKVGRILDDYALPFMREDDFDQGITGAYTALFNEVCDEYGLDPTEVSAGVIERQESGLASEIAALAITVGIVLVIASFFRRRGGRGGPGMWPLIFMSMGNSGRSRGSHRGGGFGGGRGGSVRGGGGTGRGGGASRKF